MTGIAEAKNMYVVGAKILKTMYVSVSLIEKLTN